MLLLLWLMLLLSVSVRHHSAQRHAVRDSVQEVSVFSLSVSMSLYLSLSLCGSQSRINPVPLHQASRSMVSGTPALLCTGWSTSTVVESSVVRVRLCYICVSMCT